MANYRTNSIASVTNISKALGDMNRVRILMSLLKGELCVCQLIELLGLAPSTVSKHLYILRQAGLIDSSKNGRWVFYTVAKENASGTVQAVIDWLRGSLANDYMIGQDRKRLNIILKEDPEELCLRMKKR